MKPKRTIRTRVVLGDEVYNSFKDVNVLIVFDRDYDYVVDAIDMLKNKIELIETCIEKDIKIISAMGCGNKLDPTKLEISTLDKTSVCPLARKLRQKIDKRVQKKINVVYSKELPIEKKLKDDDKVVTGSISFVTATGGLLIASKLVNDLLDGRK